MSKPLILTIHPRLEDTNLSFGDIHQGRWTELRLRNRKRLADAELAAEYWAAFADTNACMDTPDHFSYKTHAAIENAIYRFATLPHASDTDYR